jgi:hypothetical protein
VRGNADADAIATYHPGMKLSVVLCAAVLAACSHEVRPQYRRAPCSFDSNTTCEAGCNNTLDQNGPSCMALDEFNSPQFCETTFVSPDWGSGCCLLQATETTIVEYFFDCQDPK